MSGPERPPVADGGRGFVFWGGETAALLRAIAGSFAIHVLALLPSVDIAGLAIRSLQEAPLCNAGRSSCQASPRLAAQMRVPIGAEGVSKALPGTVRGSGVTDFRENFRSTGANPRRPPSGLPPAVSRYDDIPSRLLSERSESVEAVGISPELERQYRLDLARAMRSGRTGGHDDAAGSGVVEVVLEIGGAFPPRTALRRGSGNASIDRNALAMIEHAAAMVRVPDELSRRRSRLALQLEYSN